MWPKRINNYSILDKGSDYILLQDSGEGVTITNSAEAVIEDLYEMNDLIHWKDEETELKHSKHYPHVRVYYVDTEGCVDELEHKNGKFIGFKPGFKNEVEFYKHQIKNIKF